MTLLQTQQAFARLVPRLLDKAAEMGYEFTLGDAYRDPRAFGPVGTVVAYGHPRSAHKQKLALDLNLYRDGKYLDKTEDHRALGQWWEEQGTPELPTRWGGRFNDGNHYSVEFGGMR